MQIGEVAELVGLSVRTIRHWEEAGLVVPSGRSPGGFRLYTDDDAERLRLVKHMKPLDFTPEEMREVLHLWGQLSSGPDEEARRSAAARLEVYAAAAEERCAVLRSHLERAREIAGRLRPEVTRRRVPGRTAP